MFFDSAVEIALIVAGLLVAATAFRARVAKTTADAQETAIHALQDAVRSLEHKLISQEERHRQEISERDLRITALEAEVVALKKNVGVEALKEIKDHVDQAADTIVAALRENS